EDFQAVKQAIIDNIIKTIKESPSEWKIVEICTFDADMHGYYTLGATKGYQE
ncbi:3794_t:CDS:1, partial [Ambispora leptoticha]